MRRDLPCSFFGAQALLGKRDTRKVANNTYVERRAQNQIAVRLHRTDVVTFYQEGHIVLKTGGWRTVTTKARINRCLPAGWAVWSDRGQWLLGAWGDNGREWIFEDGVVILGDACDAAVRERRRRYARRAMLLPSVVAWAESHQACVDMPAPSAEITLPDDIALEPRAPRRRHVAGLRSTRPVGAVFSDTGDESADIAGADDRLVPAAIEAEDEARWAEYNRKFNALFSRGAK